MLEVYLFSYFFIVRIKLPKKSCLLNIPVSILHVALRRLPMPGTLSRCCCRSPYMAAVEIAKLILVQLHLVHDALHRKAVEHSVAFRCFAGFPSFLPFLTAKFKWNVYQNDETGFGCTLWHCPNFSLWQALTVHCHFPALFLLENGSCSRFWAPEHCTVWTIRWLKLENHLPRYPWGPSLSYMVM